MKPQLHLTNLTYLTAVMPCKGLGWMFGVGFVECVGLIGVLEAGPNWLMFR